MDNTCAFGIQLLSLKQHLGPHGKYIAVGLFGGQLNNLKLGQIIARRIAIEGSFTGPLENLEELIGIVSKLPPTRYIPVSQEELALTKVNSAMQDLKNGIIPGRVVFCAKL